MEFKNFREFYNKALNLAMQAKHNEISSKLAIVYARKVFNKTDLNSFYSVGKLKKEQAKLLHTKSTNIKFSIDSLIKNILEHPDLNLEDYDNISFILNHADDVILGTSNHLRFFKTINEKLYEVIVKNTNNNSENFLLSMHRSDLSKLRNLKLKR